MAENFVRKVTRTDFVGNYVAYIFADGHVETDPPGRPLFREDVQRQRRKEFALRQARRLLETERAKGSPSSRRVGREANRVVAGRVFNRNFHNTLHAISRIADTAASPPNMVDQLVGSFDLGGVVVGDLAGKLPEYGPAYPVDRTSRPQREEQYRTEGR